MALAFAIVGCADGEAAQPAAPPAATAASTTTGVRPATTVPAATATPATTLAPTTTEALVVVPELGLPVLGPTSLTGPADVGPELDPAGQDTVRTLMADYVARAVALPIGTGQPASLTGLLSSVLEPRLTPDQRALLTDEGVPRLVEVTVERFDVSADALAGPDGAVGVVTTRLDLVVSGVSVDGGAPVSIARRGDLTFVWDPDALDGPAWRLDSFALQVDRTLPA